MLLLVGAAVVLGSVVVGYLMHGGELLVLNQPSEFLIIGGAAIGSLLISTPPSILKRLAAQCGASLGAPLSKTDYLELLTLQYQVFRQMQQGGVMSLEAHLDKPGESPIFSRFPRFLARHHATEFLIDSLKVMLLGGISPFDLEALMDEDLEVHHHEAVQPASTLTKIGDSLPGLGIVAAVLGVVITMQAIDGPPAEIGHKVAAALVGTFLGIFLAYGFVQPLAASLEHRAADEAHYLKCLKTGILASAKGLAPIIAVEFARRVLPGHVRPGFEEAENAMKGQKAEAGEAAAAA